MKNFADFVIIIFINQIYTLYSDPWIHLLKLY